jgi:hypothetical protein
MTADLFPFAVTFKPSGVRGRKEMTWTRFHATVEEARASAVEVLKDEFNGRAYLMSVEQTTDPRN